MNYKIDNLQYCKWSREVFKINHEAGLDAIHVTVVYHENFEEFNSRIKEWDIHFKENKPIQMRYIIHETDNYFRFFLAPKIIIIKLNYIYLCQNF